MNENNIDTAGFPEFTNERNSGMSMLFVVRDGRPAGWIAAEDKIRPDAKSAIEQLSRSGIAKVAMVTGDRNGVAAKVAAALGIREFHGECSPPDKIQKVDSIKAQGFKTVFVGDGVNDAPALASSDIGIAMGAAGSDLAVETATIALLNNELDRLPFLLKLAKSYRNVMVQNFALGILFIFAGVSAGAAGYLEAVFAAFLQVASAVIIVMNSARLVKTGESTSATINP
jgi:Cd2+/Zn2+-exporting ATPase